MISSADRKAARRDKKDESVSVDNTQQDHSSRWVVFLLGTSWWVPNTCLTKKPDPKKPFFFIPHRRGNSHGSCEKNEHLLCSVNVHLLRGQFFFFQIIAGLVSIEGVGLVLLLELSKNQAGPPWFSKPSTFFGVSTEKREVLKFCGLFLGA